MQQKLWAITRLQRGSSTHQERPNYATDSIKYIRKRYCLENEIIDRGHLRLGLQRRSAANDWRRSPIKHLRWTQGSCVSKSRGYGELGVVNERIRHEGKLSSRLCAHQVFFLHVTTNEETEIIVFNPMSYSEMPLATSLFLLRYVMAVD